MWGNISELCKHSPQSQLLFCYPDSIKDCLLCPHISSYEHPLGQIYLIPGPLSVVFILNDWLAFNLTDIIN